MKFKTYKEPEPIQIEGKVVKTSSFKPKGQADTIHYSLVVAQTEDDKEVFIDIATSEELVVQAIYTFTGTFKVKKHKYTTKNGVEKTGEKNKFYLQNDMESVEAFK